ncbi:MAG: TonB-dependent receptor [Oleispira sp.]
MKILSGISLATLLASSQIIAAEEVADVLAAAEESDIVEEVVAVGHIFQGQMKSLDTQRNSNRMVNVISADGIGKLPDRNAAEAVQRLPGVSIERDQGEGRFVAVRGLPAQWSSASLNGDRIPTAEEETTSRATAFDFFPTEMIESVEVSKALTPDMEGDAIGGNVNFITRTAPKETTLDVTIGGNYNEKADKTGYNVNVLGGDTSDSGKWGYILNASAYVRNWATDNVEPRRSGEGIKRLELRDYTGERETYGFNGAAEYTLDNGDTLHVKSLYGTLTDDEIHYKHRYRFDKDRVELQMIHNILTTELFGNEVGGEHQLTESSLLEWKLASYDNHFFYGDAPSSKDNSYFVMRFDQKNVGFTGLEDRTGKNYAYNSIDGGTDSAQGISNHLPEGFQHDPAQMGLAWVELYKVDVREKDKIVAQVDFTEDMSYDLQVKFGLKYRDKERVARFSDEFYKWDVDNFGAAPTLADFDLKDQPGRDDYMEELDVNYSKDFSQVADISDVENFWNNNRDKFILDEGESALVSNGGALGRNFDVNETHTAAYGMATYNLQDEITIVGGLRLEQTQTEVKGQLYLADSNSLVDRTEKKDYISVLPSAHMTYRLDDNSNVRIAVSRSFSRPDFGALAPGGSYSEADAEFKSGNPDLDPTYAMNFDALYEHFIDDAGIISGGLFYKDITDPIFQSTSTGSYNGNDGVTFSRPENGENAWLAGAELAFSRRLDFLTASLKDFGVQTNYTHMRSVMELPDGRKAEIPRQADQLYNASIFFDNSEFAVRIAVNHKGEYIQDHGGDEDKDSFYGENTSVDLSASYNPNEQLMVFFEANNLTNEPLKYYQGSKGRPLQTEYYGMRASLGMKYSFF